MTQTSKDNTTQAKNATAVGLLLSSSLIWGAIPFISAISDGSNDPFMFTAAFGFGGAISGFLYIFSCHREMLKWEEIKKFLPDDRKTFFKKLEESKDNESPKWNWLIIVILPRLSLAFYAWATVYIPDLVAAVLLESWALLFLLLFAKLCELNKPDLLFSARNIVLLIFMFFGVVLVILSGNSEDTKSLLSFNPETFIGLGLITIAVVHNTAGLYLYKWSGLSSYKSSDSKEPEDSKHETTKEQTKMNRGYYMFVASLSTLISGIMGLVVTSFTSNSLGWANFWTVFIAGLLLGTLGSLVNVYTILSKTTNKAGIIALTPVFAVIYLWAGSYIQNVRLDIFVLGLCAIAIGSILIRFTTEERFGLTSLVIGICVSCYIVLVRDTQLDDWFPDATWNAPPEIYLASLGLSATSFGILQASRLSRKAERNREEERLVYSLVARCDYISYASEAIEVRIDIVDNLKKIRASRSQEELYLAYIEANQKIEEKLEVFKKGRKEYLLDLLEIHAELNTLTHSKQFREDHGETVAIVFLGFLTFAITLITRPEADNLVGFIFDSFGIIFAGAIVFLTMRIFDLRHERTTSIIHKDAEEDKNAKGKLHQVELIKDGDKWDLSLSILATVVVVIVLFCLIGVKWF